MASALAARCSLALCSQSVTREIGRLSLHPATARGVNAAASPWLQTTCCTDPSSLLFHRRPFSSQEKGIFDRIKDKIDPRSEDKQKKAYTEQLQRMADAKEWTLGMFANELDQATSGWRKYIPGMSKMKQVQQAQMLQKSAQAIKKELGANSTIKDLGKLSKVQKLKACVAADVEPADIDALLEQFKAMETIHRILRYRKEKGKSIPNDEDSMKLAVQMDSINVLTKEEKREMQMKTQASMGIGDRRMSS